MIFKFKLKASGVLDEKPWKNDPPKLFEAAGKRTRVESLAKAMNCQ